MEEEVRDDEKKKAVTHENLYARWGEVEARKKAFHAFIFIHLRNTLKFNVDPHSTKIWTLLPQLQSSLHYIPVQILEQGTLYYQLKHKMDPEILLGTSYIFFCIKASICGVGFSTPT